MAQKKVYDEEFKIQAVKLGREIGFSKAAIELGVNVDTLYGWNKRAKDARLDLEPGTQTPDTAMSLTEEVQKLRQQTREQAKEIARLKEENEFLADYQKIEESCRADQCIGCQNCVSHCPQSIQVPEELAKIAAFVSGLEKNE